MSQVNIQEDSFPSDEEFDDEEGTESESSTDVDAKVAEDDIFDLEFLKCYSALKKGDDKIYDQNVKFFGQNASDDSDDATEAIKSNEQDVGKSKSSPKRPKMTLLDHQITYSKDEDLDEVEANKTKVDLNKPVSKSFYEKELEEIKKSIEEIADDVDSDSDDDFLKVKDSKNSISKPKKAISAMLDRFEQEEEESLKHLKKMWNDPDNLTAEDKFLRDYILNKRYIPKNEKDTEDGGFFSKNIEDLSDAEDDEKESAGSKDRVNHHSDEKDFDKIARIPRNSTKTIRDLVEKKEKKEKRMKRLEKEKKKKKLNKNADFEDMVDDMPLRFHYRETEPNDYGLSAEELLMATDEELDKWVKLKDAIAYKSREEELDQKAKFEQRRNDINLKKQIFKSIYGDDKDSAGEDTERNQSPSKKKRKRKRGTDDAQNEDDDEVKNAAEVSLDQELKKERKKKKRKRGLNHKKFAASGVAPDRLLAYGLSKNKLKKSKLL